MEINKLSVKKNVKTNFTKRLSGRLKRPLPQKAILQNLLQNNLSRVTTETVILHVEDKTRKVKSLKEEVKQKLSRCMLKDDQ